MYLVEYMFADIVLKKPGERLSVGEMCEEPADEDDEAILKFTPRLPKSTVENCWVSTAFVATFKDSDARSSHKSSLLRRAVSDGVSDTRSMTGGGGRENSEIIEIFFDRLALSTDTSIVSSFSSSEESLWAMIFRL